MLHQRQQPQQHHRTPLGGASTPQRDDTLARLHRQHQQLLVPQQQPQPAPSASNVSRDRMDPLPPNRSITTSTYGAVDKENATAFGVARTNQDGARRDDDPTKKTKPAATTTTTVPPSATTRNSTTITTTTTTSTPWAPPSTPYALLQQEMQSGTALSSRCTASTTQHNDDKDTSSLLGWLDDSLLCSPVPTTAAAAATSTTTTTATKSHPPRPVVVKTTHAAASVLPITTTSTTNTNDAMMLSGTAQRRLWQRRRETKHTTKTPAESPRAGAPNTTTLPLHSVVVLQQQQQEPTTIRRSSTAHPNIVQRPSNNNITANHPPQPIPIRRPPTKRNMVASRNATTSTTPRFAIPRTAALQPPPGSAVRFSHSSFSTTRTARRPPASAAMTPFTIRRNGVCLDLSDIFMDATTQPKSLSPPTVAQERPPCVNNNNNADDHHDHHDNEDEWAKKQVQTFTQWLNYLFYPTESASEEEGGGGALSGLVRHQRMAQERRAALVVWSELAVERNAIVDEIGRGRIALRTDRDLYANLQQRHQIVSLFLAYQSPWLRLGLETVFGTVIPTTGRRALQNFIVQRVLSDSKVWAKYTKGKCKVPSGPFEQRYRAELRALVAYRLLTLILFLDRAKMANLLPQTPTLFHAKAAVKSTREVLLSFCRDFLKSEGDFVKHLSRVGIAVHYQQQAVDELDFTVTNLRVDLNDGVRLARLTELVVRYPKTNPGRLVSKLRLPAVSRLQKFHNVRLVLDRLVRAGVNLEQPPSVVAPYHIVDGHRERVLYLLWAVVAQCCLPQLLSVERVRTERARLQAWHRLPPDATIARLGGVVVVRLTEEEKELAEALLQWCQLVCGRVLGGGGLDESSQVVVDNLTTAFADGTVVCYLIHYYHPTLLRKPDILPTSRSNAIASRRYNLDTLLANERHNAHLANRCLTEMGGIPAMVPICDSTNPPEEKSMLLCLTYLCSRLMESSVEIRATVLIQLCYQRYRHRQVRRIKMAAARKIWMAWQRDRGNYYATQKRRYQDAVRVIECFAQIHQSKLQHLRIRRLARDKANGAATVLQKHVRSLTAQRQWKLVRHQSRSAVTLQNWWRARVARRRLGILVQRQNAARIIQYYWRVAQHCVRDKIAGATQIQRIFRGYWSRVQFFIDVLDIVAVQSCARRWIAQRHGMRRVGAVRTIQCAARVWLAQRDFQEKRIWARRIRAATRVQALVRQCLARLELRLRREQGSATIRIQSFWRRQLALALVGQLKYSDQQRRAALLIQSAWRRLVAVALLRTLQSLEAQRRAAVTIQCLVRRVDAQFVLGRLRGAWHRSCAAVTIQCAFRTHVAVLQRWTLEDQAVHAAAATALQTAWRRNRIQRQWTVWNYASTRIQANVRRYSWQRRFSGMKASATVIQAQWKTAISVQKYKAMVQRVLLIQTAIRMYRADIECCNRRLAVLRIQCCARQCLAQRKLDSLCREKLLQKAAAVVVQSAWRGFDTKRTFRIVRQDATLIQSTFRQFMAIQASQHRRATVVRLQRVARCWLARKRLLHLRKEYAAIEFAKFEAAMVVQSVFRGWLIRREILHLNEYAVSIQRVFRGHIGRIDCVIQRLDICLVQSLARRWLARRVVATRLYATLRLQCWARGCLARCKCANLVLHKSAATTIQKTWRCYTVHVDYMLYLLRIFKLQAWARRFLAQSGYEKKYCAVVCIQAFARLALYKMQAEREVRSIIKLQSHVRTFLWTKIVRLWLTEERSATFIQSYFRLYLERTRFLAQKLAATIIERHTRGFVVRLQLEAEHFASFEIQRIWRGFVAREFLASNILAAMTIQSVWRMKIAKDLARQRRLERIAARCVEQMSASILQKAFRAYLLRLTIFRSATQIQRAVSEYLSRIAFGKLRRGVLRAQSILRGKIVRKTRSGRVKALAARIETANANEKANPQMKLGHRTTAALEVLLKSKSLSEIMAAITILEIATRLSEVCCISFVEAEATGILFSLIRTCNRSLPHIQLLHGVLLTMSNVAQYEALLPSLATLTGIEVFLDLVQMFRDKDEIFCLVVSLLERVVTFSEVTLVFCASKENIKRLKSVCDLCIRKMSVVQPPTALHRNPRPYRHAVRGVTLLRRQESPDIRQGIRTLQRVIQLVKSKCRQS